MVEVCELCGPKAVGPEQTQVVVAQKKGMDATDWKFCPQECFVLFFHGSNHHCGQHWVFSAYSSI